MPNMINGDFFEAVFQQAVIQNNRNEIAAIPSEIELEEMYTFSERHNKRMRKLFAAHKRHEFFTIVYKWGKVAIVTVCISASLVFGALLTSAEVRNAIGNVIVTWFDQFTKFQSEEASDEFVKRDWSPGYLPEGFSLENTFDSEDSRFSEYKNSNENIIFFDYTPSDGSFSTDNENMEYSVIIENDITYHLFKTTHEDEYSNNIIIWDIEGYRFTITGNYSINELLKMSYSVK